MKVSMTVTFTIDPEAWDQAYGTGTDAAAIREDVRDYFTNYLRESNGLAEVDGSVEVK
jgi:hypothetical protein